MDFGVRIGRLCELQRLCLMYDFVFHLVFSGHLGGGVGF
jgi:hypothetical protein